MEGVWGKRLVYDRGRPEVEDQWAAARPDEGAPMPRAGRAVD